MVASIGSYISFYALIFFLFMLFLAFFGKDKAVKTV
jgi:hypothetical protein